MDDSAQIASDENFADVVAANALYAKNFRLNGLPPIAARGLGVVTCIDSRIEPLAMLGLAPGDAKIMRNAGARVTDDVLRTLVLAVHLLGVERVMVVAHTHCKMSQATDAQVHANLATKGLDSRSLDFGMVSDRDATLRSDVQRIDSWPFLHGDVVVAGFLYDVDSGLLSRVC